METIVQVLSGLATGIIAAYITARLSLKHYFSTKWWERKEAAYAEVANALCDMLQYLEVQKEDDGQGTGLPEDREKELGKSYNDAYWRLRRATTLGSFILSSEAQKALQELRDHPELEWNENPRSEIYENEFKYHREALDKITKIAKRDLQIQK